MYNDLKRLQELVGEKFLVENIMCEMVDEEENVIVNEVKGHTSNFQKHGECQLYNSYYDCENSQVYDIWVDCDNMIVCVK